MSDGSRSYDSRQTHVSKVSSSSRNDRSVAEPLARSDCVHMLASSATEARPTIVTINVVRPFILKGNVERGDRVWLPSREFRDGNMNQGVTLWYSSGITILQTPCTSPHNFAMSTASSSPVTNVIVVGGGLGMFVSLRMMWVSMASCAGKVPEHSRIVGLLLTQLGSLRPFLRYKTARASCYWIKSLRSVGILPRRRQASISWVRKLGFSVLAQATAPTFGA